MAHFAQLDESNVVIQVVVINNVDLLDAVGNESEELGVSVCKSIYGTDTKWVQTSYNHKFRKMFAGLGMKYDPVADVFYFSNGPFPSWVLDSNFDWQAPISKPDNDNEYVWDENKIGWVLAPISGE